MRASTPGRAGRHSFSLLEMLLVLALTAIIMGFGVAIYTKLLDGTAVSGAGHMIDDVLVEGRSDAVTQNTAVEVRIYDLAPAGATSPSYAALQLHWLKPDGTTPPINAPLLLPTGAVIDATATHSSLIAAPTQTPRTDASDPRLTADTRAFRFLPDGSTDLNPATNWFLTVRAATQSDPARFPANWAALRIDPATGRVQLYRP